ncbi:hypothetical protein I7I53_02478 [Histoplasma capsulatum var. duboisii H88]|uniref:Uncharacterized protein n=1 Tax=Ajellomyces capsulatus (strain H88) TaxID=544711 RepID=A0A8A1LKE4_AJEC8|nr:hypothetical protein I7I53_02478 [Histoplasma capsulatum var. duboisii H88]
MFFFGIIIFTLCNLSICISDTLSSACMRLPWKILFNQSLRWRDLELIISSISCIAVFTT